MVAPVINYLTVLDYETPLVMTFISGVLLGILTALFSRGKH